MNLIFKVLVQGNLVKQGVEHIMNGSTQYKAVGNDEQNENFQKNPSNYPNRSISLENRVTNNKDTVHDCRNEKTNFSM